MSLEKILCEELNHCRNCGARCLSIIIIEGKPFCNSICYTEWKRKQEEKESQDIVGKRRPVSTVSQRSMKKMSELLGNGFQNDGNQRDPPPYSVVKEEVSD